MTSHDDVARRSMRLLAYHRQRIWWITSRILVLTVIITAFGLALAPKYVARTKLTLLPTRSEIGFASIRPEAWGLSPATVLGQTHAESLLSRTLAEEVARTLMAENAAELNNGGFLGSVRRNVVGPLAGAINGVITLLNTGRWETPDPLRALADTIQSRTQVRNVPGSFVFQVAVTWENPQLAARLANLLTEHYVQMTLRGDQEELRTTREYLEARIKETDTALEELQAKIKNYRSTEKVYSVAYNTSADVDLGLQELSQSLRDMSTTRANWQQLDARISTLKPYQTPTALAVFEAERNGLKARQEGLEKVISDQIARLDKMPAKEAGLLDLYRERMLKERALGGLQDRLLDTKVAEAAQLTAARVIDAAIPPVYPERPLLLRNAAASILVGLLLSLGFVFLAETRRPGLRSREDMDDTGGGMLGLIPYVSANGQGKSDHEKTGPFAEFVRGLRYGRFGTLAHRQVARRHIEHLLVRLAEDERMRVCMFVSLNGGEGKTFLIRHLARVAESAGRRVLLIDANLARPALHGLFGKPAGPGLAEMLSGRASARDVVVRVSDAASLIGAGLATVNAQAKWAVADARRQIAEIAADYDLVLIDSAALRCEPSAVRLLALAPTALCILDATTSRRGDPEDIRARMGEAPAGTAFVLNKVLCATDYLFKPHSSGGNGESRGDEEPALSPATPDGSREREADL